MKKICLFLIFCLLLALPVPVFAEPIPTIPAQRQRPLLVDEASVLSFSEAEAVLQALEEVTETYACDVAVVTVNSLGKKSATAYADDFYDFNGYGSGIGDDGILLLISLEARDWAITTHGAAEDIFTLRRLNSMEKRFRPYLSDGDFCGAFLCFADLCGDILASAAAGESGGSVVPREENAGAFRENFEFSWMLGAVAVGFVIAIIAVSAMKSKLKSVRRQPAASSYIRAGSFQVTQSQDIFLYRNVTRTARPKDTGSSSGGHISSSGRSHGGSSGKF